MAGDGGQAVPRNTVSEAPGHSLPQTVRKKSVTSHFKP